jgi:probable phosphoglycerate mutase
VLWRHGRTAWNADGRWQGHLDPELDDTGREQAARSSRLLAGLRPSAVVSSDLRRARETAVRLARLTGLVARWEADLRETFIGSWQGRTATEVAAEHPEDLARWLTGDVLLRPGGGENRTEVAARVVDAILRGLADVPDEGTLVVVTHGGAARVAIARLLDLEHRSWGALGGLSNCCWSVLGEDGPRWRLLEHNAGSLPEPVLTEEG